MKFVGILHILRSCMQVSADSAHSEAAAILQAKVAVQFDEIEHQASESKPLQIHFDGDTAVNVERKAVKDLPGEVGVVFRNLAGQNITVNDTHALIPMGTMLHASFAKSFHRLKVREYGLANLMFGPAPQGISTSLLGAAIKFHTLAHTGTWRTDSAKFAMKDAVDRPVPEQPEARKSLRDARNKIASSFVVASNLIMQIVAAAIDPVAVKMATELVGQTPSEFLETKAANTFKDLSSAEFSATPSASATGCIHFENPEIKNVETVVSLEGEYFALRLGKNVRSYSAQVMVDPLQHFLVGTGLSVTRYNQDKNELTIHFALNGLLDFVDPDGTHLESDPVLAISSLTGENLEQPGPDMRSQVPRSGDKTLHELLKKMKKMPIDYDHGYRSDICDTDKYEMSKKKIEAFSAMAMMAALRKGDKRALMQHAGALVDTLGLLADCGTNFFNSLARKNAQGFGVNQAAVISHAMMEMPSKLAAKVLLSNQWDYGVSSAWDPLSAESRMKKLESQQPLLKKAVEAIYGELKDLGNRQADLTEAIKALNDHVEAPPSPVDMDMDIDMP